MKLYYVNPKGCKVPSLIAFLDTLEYKQRRKLLRQFSMIIASSMIPREPTVKHFTIEKYSMLYELRARSKIMIRIIFTIREDGGVLLLVPFVKKQSRDTMSALNASLKMLNQISKGSCTPVELTANDIKEMSDNEKNIEQAGA